MAYIISLMPSGPIGLPETSMFLRVPVCFKPWEMLTADFSSIWLLAMLISLMVELIKTSLKTQIGGVLSLNLGL
jgi:hypothetical protein